MSDTGTGTPTENGDQSAAAGAAAAGGDGGQGQQQKQQLPPSVLTRISEITRKRREAEQNAADERRRREALEAEIAALRAGQGSGDGGASGGASPVGGPRPLSHQEVERLAEELAEKKLSQRQISDAVKRIDVEGRKEFQDFDLAVTNFEAIGGIPPQVFGAVSRLPDAHRVLYALANDLDRASEIFSLSPVELGIELANLTRTKSGGVPNGGQQLSRMQPPIESLNGRSAGVDKSPDEMDNDEWFAWRDRQVADQRRSRQ